jgi:DNA-binding NtrC family response regulator
VRRVGGNAWIDVNVRVLAATHRELPDLVREGRFREDLFYRLAEVVVRLPPLRDRLDDLPLLSEKILGEAAGPPMALTSAALDRLGSHDWPGNVRELRNILRRAAALTEESTLSVDDLVGAGLPERSPRGPDTSGPNVEPGDLTGLTIREARDRVIEPLEKEYIEQLIDRHGPDLDAAAEEAGLHRKSLLRLMRQHGVEPAWLRKMPPRR